MDGPSSSEMPLWLVALIPVIFVVVFAGFWCFVCLLNSVFTGWSRVAKVYRAKSQPTGEGHVELAQMSLWSRQAALTFHAEDDGLYIGMTPIFAFGHPRLCVPWEAFADPKPALSIFRKNVSVQIGQPKLATLVISEKFFREAILPKLKK